MVAEIRVVVVQREMLLQHFGPQRHGETGGLRPDRVVGIADRLVGKARPQRPDRRKIGLIGRSRIADDAMQQGQIAADSGPGPDLPRADDGLSDLGLIRDACGDDHRFAAFRRAGDQRIKGVVARGDLDRIRDPAQEPGAVEIERRRDEAEIEPMGELRQFRELIERKLETAQPRLPVAIEDGGVVLRNEGLKLDRIHPGRRRRLHQLPRDADVPLMIIADLRNNPRPPPAFHRKSAHASPPVRPEAFTGRV